MREDARFVSFRLAAAGNQPFASGPTARLRQIEHRGVTSAAIVYDSQPIIDHLRRVDAGRLLGMMDLRSTPPLFFLLSRDQV